MQIINGRRIEAFSCYMKNVPEKVPQYQKEVFDLFGMELTQELTDLPFHDYWLDYKINSLEFDIAIFFDIDCIPLKPGLYEYIVSKIEDNNSIIGVEQVNQTRSPDFVYAAPACFGITREVFEKMEKPSFRLKDEYDCGGEFSWGGDVVGGVLCDSKFTNIHIENQFNGLLISRFANVWIDKFFGRSWELSGGAGGCGLYLGIATTAAPALAMGVDLWMTNSTIYGYSSDGVTPALDYGIFIEDCDSVSIMRCGVNACQHEGLTIRKSGASGYSTANMFLTEMLCDATLLGHAAKITEVNNLQMANCWFASAGSKSGGSTSARGLSMLSCENFNITGTRFVSNQATGLYLDLCYGNVAGCIFTLNGLGNASGEKNGIYVNQTSIAHRSVNISGCHEFGSDTYSILTSDTAALLMLTGNYFETAVSLGVTPKVDVGNLWAYFKIKLKVHYVCMLTRI